RSPSTRALSCSRRLSILCCYGRWSGSSAGSSAGLRHTDCKPSRRKEPMSRIVTVAAAQLGAIQKAKSPQAVAARMLELMAEAKTKGADLIVYPELALTTFFPRWYYADPAEADIWFEKEMPNTAVRPLFEGARRDRMGMSFGYAELTGDGHHFNTSILVDRTGAIVGKYRKVHLPGHAEFDATRTHKP